MSDIENRNSTIPFPSLAALHAAHVELIRRQRENGLAPELLADIDDFIQRGSASGVLLDSDADRETAQGLLDYWSTIVLRTGHEPPDATLADFDADLAPELDNALCPYVGLDSFRENENGVFFGRQRLIDELLERLRDNRLLAVVGPSGSGKSSVVRAGLVPALRAGALPGSAGWHAFAPMVPGADPLRSLARAVRPASAPAGWVAEQVEAFKRDSSHLARLLAESGAPAGVLLVDQFEEVFTLTEEEAARRAFIDNLLHVVGLPGAEHRVIVTMRSDFEPFVAREPALQARFAEGRVPVTPLSAAELRDAIEKPAALVGLKFEDGVVDALLHDLLGEPAALPLLQFTLLKLWEHRQRNRVTLDSYRRLGGGRLALARSADEFYAALIPEEQVTARRTLLRMVRPGEGLEVTSNRIRRAALYQGGEDPGRVDRVLEKLIAARLVRVSGGDTPEDEQIEVAHEALVRNWPTLVGWLEDERAALATRRRLEAKAAEWVRLGRGTSGLLDREQLLEAEHWLASPEADDLGFDPALPELVVFSRAAIEEAEAEQEAARRRELEQARALAEAERRRAEVEEQSNRRLTRLFRALAVMAIIAGIAAILALYQAIDANFARGEAVSALGVANQARATVAAQNVNLATAVNAQQTAAAQAQANAQAASTAQAVAEGLQREEAKRRRVDRANLLAAVSQAVLPNTPQRSLLLAVEALRVQQDAKETPVVTATDALRQSLLATSGRGLSAHAQTVTSVALSADGKRLLTGSEDGTARLWDLGADDPASSLVTLPGTAAPIRKVAITPDGRLLLAGDDEGVVHAWAADNPTTAPRDLAGTAKPLKSLLVGADGRWLATTGADNIIRVWDLSSLGAGPLQLAEHRQPVTDIAFGASGGVLLSSGADGVAYLWDLNGRSPERSTNHLNPRPNPLTHVALSPDGNWAAIAGEDGVTHLWRVSGATFSSTQPIVLPTGTISSFAIDPRSRWLVIGGPDGATRLWRLSAASRPQWLLAGHTGPVTALAFDQGGGRLVTASADATARAWSLDDPSAEPRVLKGHEDGITAAALAPDGATLVTGSKDASARAWDLAAPAPTPDTLPADPQELARLACRAAGRNLTPAEWQRYFDNAYRATCER
jgi:WD40 repeat protein